MTKKRILLWGINGAILLSAGAGLWGLNQDLSQSQARLQEAQTAMSQAESDKGQLSSDLAAAQAEKESLALDKLELEFKEKMGKQKVIVGKVFSNGYLKKHGNHYHFVYGKPPVDAIYEDQDQAGASSSRRGGGDNYVFNPADIVEENADGYVVRHGDHFHFISKRDLANAPTVPNAHTPGGCRLVRIPHGDHFHDVLDCGQGLGNLSFDDEPVSPRPNGPVASRPASPSQPLAPSHPADQLTRPSQPVTPSLPVDQPATPSPAPSQPEQPSTPQGPTSLLTLDSPEIQGHLDYISYAYGVERDTIKLQAVYDDAGNYRGQVFAFQNTEQGQDKSHIHPWVVPLWTLEVPSQDPSIDPELRFARELAGLAKRMGIPQRIIRIRDGYFEVPHGDHSHNIRIRNVEGSKAYVANKLASLPSIHVPGDLDEATVKAYIATLRQVASQRLAGQEVALARIEAGLQDIEESLKDKGNSTQGFLQLLDRFAARYIFQIEDNSDKLSERLAKLNAQHESILKAISELNLTNYGVTADQLREQANKAIEAQDAVGLSRLAAYVAALKDANDRPGVEAMKHLYFLTQHVQDKPLSYDLREQVSDIIARLSKTNAVFGGDDPAEPLFAPAILAKQAIELAHAQFNGKVDTRVGDKYKAITQAGEDGGPSILESNKSFTSEVLEDADKDKSLPVTNFEEDKASEASSSSDQSSSQSSSSSKADAASDQKDETTSSN